MFQRGRPAQGEKENTLSAPHFRNLPGNKTVRGIWLLDQKQEIKNTSGRENIFEMDESPVGVQIYNWSKTHGSSLPKICSFWPHYFFFTKMSVSRGKHFKIERTFFFSFFKFFHMDKNALLEDLGWRTFPGFSVGGLLSLTGITGPPSMVGLTLSCFPDKNEKFENHAFCFTILRETVGKTLFNPSGLPEGRGYSA